jgi:hypothetical protein
VEFLRHADELSVFYRQQNEDLMTTICQTCESNAIFSLSKKVGDDPRAKTMAQQT